MMTFRRYAALGHLVKYGNLYHLRTVQYPAKTEEVTDMWRATDAENRGEYIQTVWDDEVQWLLRQELAQAVESFDPLFMRGKVVPTERAKERFENPGLTPESPGIGVHIGHCCLRRHGCKYSDQFCPVATEMFPPESDRCGACYEDDAMTDEALEHYDDDELIGELVHRGYMVTKEEDDDETAEG
jgi:hypothetical protein